MQELIDQFVKEEDKRKFKDIKKDDKEITAILDKRFGTSPTTTPYFTTCISWCHT
ncbi:MAG: hypothetical protein WDO15_06650 [Bacteroidota bacterium]